MGKLQARNVWPGRKSGSWRERRGVPSSSEAPPSPPLRPILHTIKLEELNAKSNIPKDSLRISQPRYIASYSWTDSKKPTILVPGKPRLWQPLSARPLDEDSEEYFRDPNAARYPSFPTEPAVVAIFKQNTEFDCQSVDVFGCASTLGHLLDFVRGQSKPFGFDVESIGNTAFFIRREKSPIVKIPDVRGYGHTFPEAYCKWEGDVQGSVDHYRLIEYEFNGLRFVVRSKSDGYIGKGSRAETAPKVPNAHSSKPTFSEGSLNITATGHAIKQGSIFDLKTRSIRRKDRDTVSEELGRLWLTQTPNFILAHHTRGVFHDVEVKDVEDVILKWEDDNSDVLRRFGVLTQIIIAFLKSSPNSRCHVKKRDDNTIDIHEQMSDVPSALPAKLATRWAGSTSDETSDDSDGGFHGLSHYDEDDRDDHDRLYASDEGSDDGSEKDFTACSAEDCGYCGHCRY